jgi:hypothetical protein
MVKDLLKNNYVKSGIANGIKVILFALSIFAFAYISLGSQVQINIASLPSAIAVMVSGYFLKRKDKLPLIYAMNHFMLHAFGMAIVFVPFLAFTGYYDFIFSSNDFGVLAKIFLFSFALVGAWFNTSIILICGSYFYRIKLEPIPKEEKLTTISTFSDSIQAHIAKDILELNDIPAFLKNQFITNLWPINIDLQVPIKFEKKARDILQELES